MFRRNLIEWYNRDVSGLDDTYRFALRIQKTLYSPTHGIGSPSSVYQIKPNLSGSIYNSFPIQRDSGISTYTP
jgi:hypothetical protein